MSKPGKWTEWDDAALRALHEGGWPIQTAAWYFERTVNAVYQHARKLGLAFATRKAFTPDEDDTLRLNYPDLPTEAIAYVLGRSLRSTHQRANALGLRKSDKFNRSKWAARWDPEHPRSKAHRFKKGHVPANKGVKRPGWAPGRMAATQFKKGQMSGAARHNYMPIGSERIKDGVLCRKVTDDPTLYPARRWVPVHRMVWEAVHGPVPDGHVVRFKDGQKTHDAHLITVDRLELVSLAENMHRNSVHRYPEQIVHAVQLRAALNRRINRMTKEQSHE